MAGGTQPWSQVLMHPVMDVAGPPHDAPDCLLIVYRCTQLWSQVLM